MHVLERLHRVFHGLTVVVETYMNAHGVGIDRYCGRVFGLGALFPLHLRRAGGFLRLLDKLGCIVRLRRGGFWHRIKVAVFLLGRS